MCKIIDQAKGKPKGKLPFYVWAYSKCGPDFDRVWDLEIPELLARFSTKGDAMAYAKTKERSCFSYIVVADNHWGHVGIAA